MYLLILESIGTQELILIGIVALIVFGPRKLPEMARKAGGLMRELRSVSNDFKSTWAQEVRMAEKDFIDPIKKDLTEATSIISENGVDDPGTSQDSEDKNRILPEVRQVSEEDFKKLVADKEKTEPKESDKENWL